MMIKSYNELRRLDTFEERFEYLRLRGVIGESTFGFERYLNQALYHSREWKYTKSDIILRDNSCDLGVPGYEIRAQLLIHHINPVSIEDIEVGADCVFDPENLITTQLDTHNALHYGNADMLPRLPIVRRKSDTCLWH
jgi:hypothetical protein